MLFCKNALPRQFVNDGGTGLAGYRVSRLHSEHASDAYWLVGNPEGIEDWRPTDAVPHDSGECAIRSGRIACSCPHKRKHLVESGELRIQPRERAQNGITSAT
jgi:hypothetical protein